MGRQRRRQPGPRDRRADVGLRHRRPGAGDRPVHRHVHEGKAGGRPPFTSSSGSGRTIMADPKKYYTSELQEFTREKIARIGCPVFIAYGNMSAINKINNDIVIPELKAAGKAVEVVLYPDEPHGFSKGVGTPKAALKFFTDTDAFFQKQLPTKPRPLEAALVKAIPIPMKRGRSAFDTDPGMIGVDRRRSRRRQRSSGSSARSGSGRLAGSDGGGLDAGGRAAWPRRRTLPAPTAASRSEISRSSWRILSDEPGLVDRPADARPGRGSRGRGRGCPGRTRTCRSRRSSLVVLGDPLVERDDHALARARPGPRSSGMILRDDQLGRVAAAVERPPDEADQVVLDQRPRTWRTPRARASPGPSR